MTLHEWIYYNHDMMEKENFENDSSMLVLWVYWFQIARHYRNDSIFLRQKHRTHRARYASNEAMLTDKIFVLMD
ncbi:hypothetical protein BLA29_003895 [Euroglyphus maynei]|uniref:Uncharacterized protein n=1 Tax=Euroglyphus maynei TaxID=6958 RepID=A0A1Y3BKK1_EURMA|nr:hypothetical protein BLA29_003895 [Euroglyphus maynei]